MTTVYIDPKPKPPRVLDFPALKTAWWVEGLYVCGTTIQFRCLPIEYHPTRGSRLKRWMNGTKKSTVLLVKVGQLTLKAVERCAFVTRMSSYGEVTLHVLYMNDGLFTALRTDISSRFPPQQRGEDKSVVGKDDDDLDNDGDIAEAEPEVVVPDRLGRMMRANERARQTTAILSVVPPDAGVAALRPTSSPSPPPSPPATKRGGGGGGSRALALLTAPFRRQ
jgi:hypothetical protein